MENSKNGSNDPPSASFEPSAQNSKGLPSADDCAHSSGSNQQAITPPFATDNNSTVEATPVHQQYAPDDHVTGQQWIPDQELPEETAQGKPMSTNSEMRKQMTILDPALTAAAVPSTTAPTVYALASKVPFPTVNQLIMNIPNQPVVQEQVAVSFKTILCSPPRASATNSLDDTTQDQQQEQQREKSPEDPREEYRSVTSYQSPDHDDLDQFPGNDIHPYFAAANFLKRPQLSGSQSQHSSAESSVPKGLKRSNSGLPSLPQATSFFTASSNSNTVPVHHAVHDRSLDPSLVKKKADELQRVRDDEATAATDENSSVGSRSTVFGFAPLYNKVDHQATMRSGEERVLKDSLVCRAMPLSGRLPSLPAHNNESSNISGEASPLNDCQSPTGNGQLQAVPHARAGISRTLNLDKLESGVDLTVTDSEESVESLIETKDWSKTGLGPRSSWPAELNMLMPLLMRSAAPLAIYWGDQNYLIYNDVSVLLDPSRITCGTLDKG